MKIWNQLRVRPRLLLAVGVGLGAAWFWPAHWSPMMRGLLSWNLGVWLYLALVFRMMRAADQQHVQTNARAQADGIATVLLLAVLGALASLGAITLELSQLQRGLITEQTWPYLLLALATVAGSWLLLPVEFALAYASLYHTGADRPHGLEFPGEFPKGEQHPGYIDFMYFSVTLAATSQTSDVAVSARPMRRLVLLHAMLSFLFNTGVLALAINILAGLIK